jgi:hypothetical protein
MGVGRQRALSAFSAMVNINFSPVTGAAAKRLDALGWKWRCYHREAGPVGGMVRPVRWALQSRPSDQRWRAGRTDVAHGTSSVTATLASLTDQAAE